MKRKKSERTIPRYLAVTEDKSIQAVVGADQQTGQHYGRYQCTKSSFSGLFSS